MGKRKKKQLQKGASVRTVYTGMDRREFDDPGYFGYFILEGRERRWSKNMIVTRMERALGEVLSRLNEYKHLAPYGVR